MSGPAQSFDRQSIVPAMVTRSRCALGVKDDAGATPGSPLFTALEEAFPPELREQSRIRQHPYGQLNHSDSRKPASPHASDAPMRQ